MKYEEKLNNDRKIFAKQYKKRDNLAREWCNGLILEIGCGEYPVFEKSVRIDIRPIKGVLQHNANERLPFKDETFDSIVAFELIEHLWNTRDFLNECYRVLKPEGKLIMSTPNIKHWRNRLDLLLGNDGNFIVEDYGHIRYFSPERLKEYTEKCGFEIIEIRTMGRIPFLNLCGGFIIECKKPSGEKRKMVKKVSFFPRKK